MHGSFSLPRAQFIDEVRSFHHRLMDAMSDRVSQVAAGALGAEIAVDIPGLLREHEHRQRLSERNLEAWQPPTDWDAVREALEVIGASSGGA